MKIILIGAPGSGKSDIAKRLARNLNRDWMKPSDISGIPASVHAQRWVVIDGYIDRLTKRTGCVYGKEADYEHNLQIVVKRWTLEAEADHQGCSTITCGSMYETLFWSSLINSLIPPSEEAFVYETEVAQIAMGFLGEMERRTFNYNAIFYLPWSEEQRSGAHSWEGVLDAKLLQILDGMHRFGIPLAGTPRQKVTHALEVIRAIRAEVLRGAASSDDEPTV